MSVTCPLQARSIEQQQGRAEAEAARIELRAEKAAIERERERLSREKAVSRVTKLGLSYQVRLSREKAVRWPLPTPRPLGYGPALSRYGALVVCHTPEATRPKATFATLQTVTVPLHGGHTRRA